MPLRDRGRRSMTGSAAGHLHIGASGPTPTPTTLA
jgi:hypothetical protein